MSYFVEFVVFEPGYHIVCGIYHSLNGLYIMISLCRNVLAHT